MSGAINKDKRYFVAMSQEHWHHYTQGYAQKEPKGGVVLTDRRGNGLENCKSPENRKVSLTV